MKNSHDLNIRSKFNESEEKSDVSEAEKSYEPVKEEYDSLENEENGLSTKMEVDESKCDMIQNTNVFYSEKDGTFGAEQYTDDSDVYWTKHEIDSDKSDPHVEDTQDSKSFSNEFLDPEGKIWNREDDFTLNRISEFVQHSDHPNTVKSEPPDFGIGSGCDERINERTDVSDDDIDDNKFFVKQCLDEERKLWDSIGTISSEIVGTTKSSQHTTLVASEPLEIGTQSGRSEIINKETNLSEDEAGDSKCFIHQYLDEEGKLSNNIDTIFLKKEGTSKCSQHTTLVASEPLGIGTQSGCSEIINEETNVSEDEAGDSKCFIHQYLDEEGKLYNNIDTISLKKEGPARELHENEILENEDVKGSSCKCYLDECGTTSGSNADSHMCDVHQKMFECPMCENVTGSNLQLHIDTAHLKVNKNKCKLCDSSALNSENMMQYFDTVHLEEKKQKCNLCEFSTANIVDLNCHIEDVHKCHMCDFSTANTVDLTRHIDNVHLKVKKHKCHLCDYSTAYNKSLKGHIDSIHLKVKKHNCHLCDYSSAFSSNLKSHIDNVHLKVKKHNCHLCDYSFALSSNLKCHIDSVHLKVKKHNCHLCDYSSALKSHLKCHIDNVHLKVKKHKCVMCDYRTSNTANLKCHIDSVHLKVTREKKHKCHLCNYSTSYSSSLKSHIDNVHLKVTREKKHKCHLCNYSTSYSSSLKSHIDNVHLKEKKHKCHLCEYSTARSDSMKRHIDSVHLKVKREKKHKCELCDYGTAYSGNLKGHIDSVHSGEKKY